MTMAGGGPPGHRALAPHIEYPVRRSIVEAIEWIGPLSAPDLKQILDGSECHLVCIAYHLKALTGEEVLAELGRQPAGASIEVIYYLPLRPR
jgi:hypothetical protein